MSKVFIRAPYNYDADEVSLETGIVNEEPSLTVQSDADDADINTIVRRFGLTGQLPTNVRLPISEDFVDIVDFQSAMNAMRAAEESFAAMPADVRTRFGNDPARFTDFCTDEVDGKLVNIDELRKLGLAIPAALEPEPPAPIRVVIDNPTPEE